MASRDGLIKTETKGVFYREHISRKNGVIKDRQYVIRQTIGAKERKSTFGWVSLAKQNEQRLRDGNLDPNMEETLLDKIAYSVKSYEAAISKAEEYRENHKWNLANPDRNPLPICRDDENRLVEENIKLKTEEKQKQSRLNTTVEDFFDDVYLPQCKIDKAPSTATTEELLFNHWIRPVIGTLRFDQIGIDHLDKIKQNMLAGKRGDAKKHPRDRREKAKNAHLKRNSAKPMSARSINYAMAIIRQIWNRACSSNPPLAVGNWAGSTKAFKKPKIDNQRKRFLTKNEAILLLSTLRPKSQNLHDMALLSLHCGLRAGEIFKLTWDKVNLKKREILLSDTKNSESRISYLTDPATDMLRNRSLNCQHQRFVFLATNDKPYKQVPVTFSRTVKQLGLNQGAADNREKVVFHTLRHTYASWLVENGSSLPIVRDLLGHKNLIMTSRYSHVSAEAQKQAVEKLSQSIMSTVNKVTNISDATKTG